MKKFITIVALAAVFSMGASANAATLEETIAALQAQIAALSGNTTVATTGSMLSAHNGVNLKVGVRGARVSELQACMNAAGYNTGVVDGIFGNNTKTGVMAFQASKGLVVDGIVGVATTPAFQTACSTTSVVVETETETTTSVSGFDTNDGDEAEFTDFDLDDADDDTIEEGQDEAEIAEIEFDLEDEGAALLERFDIVVALKDINGTTAGNGQDDAEDDAWDTFTTFYLMVDGDVIAEMDADDEDDWEDVSIAGNDYDDARFRISGINHVFDADETHTIVVAADVAGSVDLDGGKAEWEFVISDNSLRFVDEAGITQYLTEESGIDGDTADFTIEEEGQDDELTIRESDNDPEATALQVEDDEKSDWYNIFTFEADVDEDSQDLEFKEVVLTLTVDNVAAGKNVSDVVNDLKIALDGNENDDYELSSEVAATATTPATAIVTFDTEDEDFMIDSDESEDIELWAEFNAANAANYAQGATIMAQVTSANGDTWDVEGGEDLDATQIKGAAEGEEHTLLVDGAVVTLNSVSESVASSSDTSTDDTAKFTFSINAEAFDEPIYIPVVSATAVTYEVIDAGTNSTAGGTATASISSSATKVTGADALEYFKVSSDKDFTVKVTSVPAAAGDFYAELSALNITSEDVTEAGFTFTATPIVLDDDEFRTDVVTTLN